MNKDLKNWNCVVCTLANKRVRADLIELVKAISHQTRKVFTRTWLRLRSGLCCRKSVCPSVCLSSVMLVHPTQAVEALGNISSLLCILAIFWSPCKILRRSSQGNLSVGGVKRKRGSKIQRFWTYQRLSHKRYNGIGSRMRSIEWRHCR